MTVTVKELLDKWNKVAEYALNIHWINVKEDLPCNHEELLNLSDKRYTLYVAAIIHSHITMSRMYELDGKWYWENDEPTHWLPIPKLPKLGVKL